MVARKEKSVLEQRKGIGNWFAKRTLEYAWDLVCELVVRDFKTKYKRSLLGVAWALLVPLSMLFVFQFVFKVVMNVETPRFNSFVFTGLLVYSWFSTSLVQSASAITGNANLIVRPGFPVGALPIVMVTINLINFLIALPVLLLFLVLDDIALNDTIVFLPVLLLPQFLLTLSLAYLVATMNVLFRDTTHLLGMVLSLLMFLSPIFYEARRVPEEYLLFYNLNPLVHLLEAYRLLLLGGTIPDLGPLSVLVGLSMGLLALTYKLFSRMSHRFIEEL